MSESAITIRARPTPAYYFIASVFLIFICALAVSIQSAPPARNPPPAWVGWIAVSALLLIFGSPAVFLVGYAISREMIVDQAGLRWRRWWTWDSAAWSDVEDYYHTGFRYGPEIRLRDGRTVPLVVDCNEGKALMDAVQKRATASETGRWEPRGTRTSDFPTIFAYPPDAARKQRRSAALLALLPLGIIGLGLWIAFLAPDSSRQAGDRNAGITFALLGCVLFVMVYAALRNAARIERRLGGSYTAHREGIVFRSVDGEETSVPWEQIVGLDFLGKRDRMQLFPPEYFLRTDDGRTFTFGPALRHYRLLMHVLRQRAVNAVEQRLSYNTSNSIGGVAARWTGGEEGKGFRVYHARIRSNYIPIPFSAALVALPTWLLALLGGRYEVPFREIPSAYLVGGIAAFAALLWLIYSARLINVMRAIVRPDALDWRTPFGRREIRWDRITELDHDASGNLLLRIDGEKPVSIPTTSLAFGSELRALVEDRVKQAALAPPERSTATRDASFSHRADTPDTRQRETEDAAAHMSIGFRG